MQLSNRETFRRIGPLAIGFAFIIFACTLVGTEKSDQKFSFNKSFDTLALYDSVEIILRDTTGRTIDILYKGKADTIREIENLPAPHWDGGGIVIVSVVGFQAGEIVYRVDRKYSGKDGMVLDTVRVILPGTLLKSEQLDFSMLEGDSVAIPIIVVSPPELSDRTLSFSVSNPELLAMGNGFLRALKRGEVDLIATLKSNPSKTLSIRIAILANPLTPVSLVVAPDSLQLAVGGSPGMVSAKVEPATADPAIVWRLLDSSVAAFTSSGRVQGLKMGRTQAIAVTKRNISLVDTVVISVSQPVPVVLVRFAKDSIDLFEGGAPESLLVEVLPAMANPAVQFTSSNPKVAVISDGRVLGLAEGNALVVVKSWENPAISDTVQITVFPTQKIDSVLVTPDTLRLFTGGESGTARAQVFPLSSNQSLFWRGGNRNVANVDGTGKVIPVAPGLSKITVLSRVDSTRQDSLLVVVKRDMPVLNVGRDTVLSLGSTLVVRPIVSQEFGGVVQFRWDLNGDGTFEGSSDTLKSISSTFTEAKEIFAAFYVKDTEGNDTTVFKKIRVVSGPAVLILSPFDSTYTRLFSIDVAWSVNGKEQDSLKKQVLKIGANIVTRSAKDEAGNLFSDSVTVFVDTTTPSRPVVRGPSITNSQTPQWSWTSGGGGSGEYRYWIDIDDSSKGFGIKDTVFIPPTDFSEGVHTLFVSERDRAGNWSHSSRHSIRIDLTPPQPPNVSLVKSSPTNDPRAGWKWTSGGGGKGWYRFKLEDEIWSTGTEGAEPAFIPKSDLAEGSHILFVQEQDSAGNWSKSGSAAMVVDITPPNPPILDSLPYSPLNTLKPRFTWKSGGGAKVYRVGIDAADLATAPEQTDSVVLPSANLTEGGHILYVQERDVAGNWSVKSSRKFVVVIRKVLGTGALSDFRNPNQSALDIGRNGEVFVAYEERIGETAEGFGIIQPGVKKLNGIVWESLGSLAEFGTGIFSAYGISIDAYGTPYVGIRDSLKRASVLRHTGGKWQPVGTTGFTPENSGEYSLGLSPTNVPHVFFSDMSVGRKGTVLRYTGFEWEPVGPRGFTLPGIIFTKIVFNSLGTPFIAFVDLDGFKILRYSNLSLNWEPVGNLNVHSVGGFPINISMSGKDTLYVALATIESGGKGHVFKFNGSIWENVGDAAFEAGAANHFDFASHADGSKFIAYVDKTNGDRLTFKGLKENKWIAVGPATIPTFAGGTSRIVLDPLGVPHVAGMDDSNGSKTVLQNGAFDP